MNNGRLEELFSAHAEAIGVPISMAGVKAEGYIFLSIEGQVEMKVAPRKRGLSYLEYSDRARHLRLDASLIAYLSEESSKFLVVDVPIGEGGELPPQLSTLPMKVFPATGEGRVLVDVPVAGDTLHYTFEGYVGLEDLLGVARDALLLAEASPEMECQGPHEGAYEGHNATPSERLQRVMMLRYKICHTCLGAMSYMRFPMAPSVPEGWE